MNRWLVLALGAIGFLALFFSLGGAGESAVWVNHYIFVGLYLAAAAYAVVHDHMLAAATACSVALVRFFIAEDIVGFPFHVASITFAILFFLLIVVAVRDGLPSRVIAQRRR